jgi:hypothetical protein
MTLVLSRTSILSHPGCLYVCTTFTTSSLRFCYARAMHSAGTTVHGSSSTKEGKKVYRTGPKLRMVASNSVLPDWATFGYLAQKYGDIFGYCLMRLCQPTDGSTSPKYKLLHF